VNIYVDLDTHLSLEATHSICALQNDFRVSENRDSGESRQSGEDKISSFSSSGYISFVFGI